MGEGDLSHLSYVDPFFIRNLMCYPNEKEARGAAAQAEREKQIGHVPLELKC